MQLTAHTVIVLLLTVCASSCAVSAQATRTTITLDLDGDGQRESVVLDGGKDPVLSILHGRNLLWRGVHRRWNPWKLLTADVDGDGHSEIIVGVHKATHYFPKPHNCMFIYGWDGRRAFPKWLGSSLSKPFTDFTFADLNRDGQDELIAIETRRDGKQSVAGYSWNGFGFTLDWQRGAWDKARLIGIESKNVIVEADGERIALTRE